MLNTKGLKLEVRLSAYLDGEVNEVEQKEIEQLVDRDEEARRILERLKSGDNFGRSAFEAFLHDPVPLALVREIKQGPGTRGVGGTSRNALTTKTAPRQARNRLWPRALAAAIALLAIGGSTGFLIGKTANDDVAPAKHLAARDWLDDIAVYHRLYARQQTDLVPASSGGALESFLGTSVGVPFRRPDLTGNGLKFEGGRLLVAGGKPVGQLVYRNADGALFAICFAKGAQSETGQPETDDLVTATTKGLSHDKTESMRDALAMISWRAQGASYVVIGPSADANLQQIAERVSVEM